MPATPRKAMLGVYQYCILSFTDRAEQYIVLRICMVLMLPAVGKCKCLLTVDCDPFDRTNQHI